jgi:hypothetical protein
MDRVLGRLIAFDFSLMPARPKKRTARKAAKRPRKPPAPYWAAWKTEDLLDLRFRDLDLKIEKTPLQGLIQKIREELARRGLRVKPYYWFSDDWFTPSGLTGTAIPFYLAHPRLTRLERKLMGEVEGGTRAHCLQLLRHEAGHVIDHAFRLNRRRAWQRIFGRSSHRYPRFYRPNPYSRQYVQHLEYWYAQSHPDEDFAETFAVWLQPRSGWKKRYKDWPALRKLEYVDALMKELAGKKPPVQTRQHLDRLAVLPKTLGEHYKRKLRGVGDEFPPLYDADLRQLFTSQKAKGSRAASSVIGKIRSELVRSVARGTGENPYLLKHVIKDMMGRCRELSLFAKGPEASLKVDLAVLVTKHVMNSVYREGRWVEM